MNESREQLPARTTPTWELELIVSGATTLGLLQLPQLLDHGYFRAMNLVPQDYAQLFMPLWLYSKIAVVVLALTFLTHLCLRGYWVALVGLNSVYPGGIRWDRLGLGPIARGRFEQESPQVHIDEAIERADNRATRVFGTGFSFALLMLAPVLLVLIAVLVAICVQASVGEGYTLRIFGGVLAIVLVPWMLAAILDRRLGHLVQGMPQLARLVGAVIGIYGRLGFGPRSNPLVALFASNAGRVRFALTALLVIMPVSFAIVLAARGRLPFGLFAGLGAQDPFSATTSAAAFYADEQADRWAMVPLPHIRSRVVSGPYLEVFVPFVPRLHGAALPMACPELESAGASGRARLDCLGAMLALQLDGAPVEVALDATSDPQTGQQGLLAMIPVGALAPGRHELSLNEPDRRALDAAPLRRYRIPFWK
jgi:hypothetical protein